MPGVSLMLGLVLAGAAGANEADLLAQAEEAFREGVRQSDATAARRSFQAAAATFAELQRRGVRNPVLFRNQGNAHLLAGDLPRAIRAYRQGLRLAPADPLLRANLAYAREQVVYTGSSGLGRPPVDHWPPWLPRPEPRFLCGLALVCYSAAWLLLGRWWMTRQGWLLAGATVVGVICAMAAVGLGLDEVQRRRDQRQPLVVLAADNVHLRVGNGLAYPVRYATPLHRGVEARLRFRRGSWVQLELTGGEVGWVPRAAVLLEEE